jgi:hypothetical protein
MDIRDALPDISDIRRVHSRVLAEGRQPTPSNQLAIRAVWSAVDNTRMYLRMIKNGQVDASAPNRELVELWSEASLQLMQLDQGLAQRLRTKAEYWSDPRRWEEQQIDDAGIGIDEIASDARALLQLAMPKPPDPRQGTDERADAFVSHASEDRESVVEPLAAELTARGRTIWFDRFELTVGDHLMTEVDRGLSRCRFGVVVLTRHFIAKDWPRMELYGLLALETSDGRKRILPVRDGLTHNDVAGFSPLLAGRLSVSTEIGIPAVADALNAAIMRDGD